MTPEMDSTGSIAAIEASLERLNKQRSELEELWAMRKMKLDLYLKLRLFERDALEVNKILSYPLLKYAWITMHGAILDFVAVGDMV